MKSISQSDHPAISAMTAMNARDRRGIAEPICTFQLRIEETTMVNNSGKTNIHSMRPSS
jgi:hypothetical protein